MDATGTAHAVPGATRPAPRWLDAAITAGIVVLALLFLWLRIPQQEHSVVWAEDGHTFLLEAAEHGAWTLLLEPYAGYQHLLPRILTALILDLAPFASYALAIFVVCTTITAGIAAATYWLAAPVVAWRPARIGLAAVPVVLPLLGPEIIGNLADLHTYCMWLALWIVLWTPRTWLGSAIAAVVVLACVLTEVQAVLLVPVALARLRPRMPRMWPVVAAVVVGAVVQIVTWVRSPRTGYEDVAIGLPDIVVGWLASTVLPIVSGSHDLNRSLVAEWWLLAPLLALVPLAIAALVVLWRGTAAQRGTAIVLALLSACIFGGSLLGSPSEAWHYASFRGDDWGTAWLNLRYGGAAGLYAAALVPLGLGVLVDRHPWFRARRGARIGAAVVVAAFVAWLTVQAPLAGSARGGVESWDAQVATAEEACDAGAEEFTFIVAPGARSVTLSCAMIGDAIDRAEHGEP